MKQPQGLKNLFTAFGAAALLAGGAALAGDMGKAVIDDKGVVEESSICDIFDYSTLYKSDAGILNSVALIGQYQGQYHSVDSNQGSNSDWENRRVRL
ncbi:MAG: hypothetical protein HKN23_12585, partial [Verrucomicrobiales bacterium]|nr:hypothetical protein [Verrucomicrobiales bacterium]